MRLVDVLLEEGVPLEPQGHWTDEEYGNYIIDKFNTFIIGYTYGWEAKEEFVTMICNPKSAQKHYRWRMQ